MGSFSEGNRTWTILTTTTGITGFNAASWTIGTGSFTSSPTWAGTWELTQSVNDLVLSYAIPEPGTWALLAFSLTAVMVLRRRRKK
ncbi:MAG: PEP-CTERM sorting domain-containing protein [Verrucomicrobiae bacterium]